MRSGETDRALVHIEIGVAIVERDGCFLVGRRSPASTFAGFAEFPGGKREPGEPIETTVVRECREETGIDVEPVERLDLVEQTISRGSMTLHFWRCRITDAGAASADHPLGAFRWVPRDELATLTFPPANSALLARLLNPACNHGVESKE